MVAYTKSISNTVGFVGGKPAQPWGSSVTNATMVWGTNKWGNKLNFENFAVTKSISENLVLSGATFVKSIEHVLTAESLSLSESFIRDTERSISNSLDLTGDSSSQTLRDSEGYFYVFRRPTTNNETTVNSDYQSQSAGTASFTSASNPSTTWS